MSSSLRWSSRPSLSLLPAELLDAIVYELSSKDIISLAKTSKLMHQRMIPFLYATVELHKKVTIFEEILELPDWSKHERTLFREDGSKEVISTLDVAKDLRILPEPQRFFECCLKTGRTLGLNVREDAFPEKHFRICRALDLTAKEIFSHVQEQKLAHFAWMLGHCMPDEVLGPQGYITINQSNLKSLSLAVDGRCPGNGLEGLSRLKNLRHFSWRGIVAKRNFELVRSVIRHNADHLVSLDVEIRHRSGASPQRIELELNWLGLMALSPRYIEINEVRNFVKKIVQLKSLTSLSLRHVSLAAWKYSSVLAFDLARLNKLMLEYCKDTRGFFDTWDRTVPGFSLRSLSVIIHEFSVQNSFFLNSFASNRTASLEELFVSSSNIAPVRISFSRYSGLKRIVFSTFESTGGERTESILPYELSIRYILHRSPCLEGLAFARSPHNVRRELRFVRPSPKLKVIHFRTAKFCMEGMRPMVDFDCSTKVIIDSIKQYERYENTNTAAALLSELVDFAAWAFDCTAFPNLAIIAMGEFSRPENCIVLRHRDNMPRYSQGLILPLLRAYNDYRHIDSAPMIPFEIVNALDPEPWKGLEECRQMLLANPPTDPWFEI